ncbi:MAG: NAD(P)/FAD-dependent oxidoreductase [Gemmataceae bacterium]
MTSPPAQRVVIVGGGFGGLTAARKLRSAPVQVTLVDRRNFHLFQPLLYQVATGALSPANIATPLRAILKRQKNTQVMLGEVTDIDVPQRRVLADFGPLAYDTLIVATGATHHYFGHDNWATAAPGLKTIEDATAIRRRVLLAFEEAERTTDPERRKALLTFLIVGGGPTGLEMAGAIAELADFTLARDFRAFDPSSARIILVEGMERVLPPYPPDLSAKAKHLLEKMGVEVWLNAKVIDVQPQCVTVERDGEAKQVPAHTLIWAAGVKASPLGQKLAAATGAELDRAGRVKVQPDLSLPGHPEIFVIGDMALVVQDNGQPVPGVAPAAIQQGAYVARVIDQRLRGREPPPFRYHNKGSMATIGRAAAVADLGCCRFSGWLAWLAWLFIHLLYIIRFENRVLILIQWAWNYFTRNRSARLIAHPEPPSTPRE